jgi:hypothetical protein
MGRHDILHLRQEGCDHPLMHCRSSSGCRRRTVISALLRKPACQLTLARKRRRSERQTARGNDGMNSTNDDMKRVSKVESSDQADDGRMMRPN